MGGTSTRRRCHPRRNMSQNHLDQWIAAEKALMARLADGPGPGVTAIDQVASLSGLELLQAMLHGELPYPPICATLDFILIEAAQGRAVFQGTPGPQLFNPMGAVHGGWFATLLDSALSCAVHSMVPAGRACTTAELGLHLIKAITPKVPRVRAEGRVIHCGRQLATAEARLLGPDGTLYAHATTNCLVFDLPTG